MWPTGGKEENADTAICFIADTAFSTALEKMQTKHNFLMICLRRSSKELTNIPDECETLINFFY